MSAEAVVDLITPPSSPLERPDDDDDGALHVMIAGDSIADPATLDDDGLLERSSRAASGFRQVYKLSSGKFTAWLGVDYLGVYSSAREAAFARARAVAQCSSGGGNGNGGRSSPGSSGNGSSSSGRSGGGGSSIRNCVAAALEIEADEEAVSEPDDADKGMGEDEAEEEEAHLVRAGRLPRKLPRNVYKLTGNTTYSMIMSIGGVKTSRHGFPTPQEAKAVADRLRGQLAPSGRLPPNWERLEHGDLLEAMLARRQKPPQRKRARKGWTAAEKGTVLQRQGGRCKAQYPGCSGRLLDHRVEFDHVDGDATNKALSNAQALCCNCHAFKTRCIAR
jgi:hypothetical protein